MSDDTDLVCPDCGEDEFSYIVEEVQFGTVHEYDNGYRDVVMHANGDVKGTDIDENGVFCTDCNEFKEIDDLEPKVEVTNE
jgi:predicted  nucleic acid-binding Zn-ribbon protein